VAQFDGGVERLLRFLADGMALAFRPERAGGETGLVQFVVQTPDRPVDLWLELRAESCQALTGGSGPDTRLTLALPVFLRIAFKRISGADAYIDGAVIASGDVVLGATLDDWFDPPDIAAAQAML
jgi:hypothetical protein